MSENKNSKDQGNSPFEPRTEQVLHGIIDNFIKLEFLLITLTTCQWSFANFNISSNSLKLPVQDLYFLSNNARLSIKDFSDIFWRRWSIVDWI